METERHSRVSVVDLRSERLDPGFYAASYFFARKIFIESKLPYEIIGDVFEPWCFGAYALCNDIEWSDPMTGVPYFKAESLGTPLVRTDGLSFVTSTTHKLLTKSQVKAGDLVVATSGTIGPCAVVPHWMHAANSNQDTIKIRPLDAGYDSHFVGAWFSSTYMQEFMKREGGGAVQHHLYLYNFKQLPILKLALKSQQYIGEKVRQAERLRANARICAENARVIFDQKLNFREYDFINRLHRRVSSKLLADRLDLNFNSPNRLAILEHINNLHLDFATIEQLCEVSAMIGWKGLTTEHYTEKGPWLLRGFEFDDGVIDFDALTCIEKVKYEEQPQIHFQKGDVAMTKDGTIGRAIVIPNLSNQMAAGSTVARLRILNFSAISPYYLEFCINHPILQIQILGFATGMAQPHITQEWIQRLLIPRIPEESIIGDSVRQHHVQMEMSNLLIEVAKLLVEALVECKITEDELIEAQNRLEKGDASREKAIFRRLFEGGLDATDTRPLFPDLDSYYETLRKVEREQTDMAAK